MSQGLIYEWHNFLKNFRCRSRSYLYDLGRISSSKHETCKSQKVRIFDYVCEILSFVLKDYNTNNF